MKKLAFIPAIIFIMVFAVIAQAQNDDIIRVDTDLVTVNVSVKDKNGNAIRGLKADQFEVLDNRTKQPLDLFSSEEGSVSYGIVYDMHPTTDARTLATLESLRQFTKELPASDRFFVTVFNERGNLTTEFVPTAEQVTKNLNSGAPNSLYDAIYQAAGKLQEHKTQKHTLLIISDGADHNSHHSYKELRRRLRGMNAQVYAVILDDRSNLQWSYSDISRNGPARRVPFDAPKLEGAAIADIAKRSGGESYSETAENRQRLYAIYREINSEIKQQYTLGFSPEITDGKWHSLTVRVLRAKNDRKKPVLSYRKGYQSPSPKK